MSEAVRAEAAPGADALPERPAIQLRSVSKSYGVIQALIDVDLDIRRGEWVTITGPSGCGKSTLIHLIAALDRPTSGRIEVCGQDLKDLHRAARFRRETIGVVFQLYNLLPQLSAEQNVQIALFGRRSRRQRWEVARNLLAAVDLQGREQRVPPRMSGGERQRVAIARALANDPAVLLADEPTAALDAASVQLVVDLFGRLRQSRPELTLVTVSHDARVMAAADRVITMQDGRIAHP